MGNKVSENWESNLSNWATRPPKICQALTDFSYFCPQKIVAFQTGGKLTRPDQSLVKTGGDKVNGLMLQKPKIICGQMIPLQ
jgi:hypothetical protein